MPVQSASCPAIFITAPASGQGKTTVTAALARMLKRQGKQVRVFKTGPDYLDPQILAQASDHHVEQIDLWMAGEQYCREQFYQAAKEADLIIIEGVMGVFDGTPSSADLAALFNIPMVLVMDVRAMAQTAGAIALGLASYRTDVNFVGVIANSCSTQRHKELISEALTDELPLLASLPRSEEVALPERHLGLVQASEISAELEERLEAAADWLLSAGLENIEQHFSQVEFAATEPVKIEPQLQGKVIAVAKDEAFSFIYQANLTTLKQLGAEVIFFSPLHDDQVPNADAIWLPGGYPELYAKTLAENKTMIASLQTFAQQSKPMLAECGGFLYCLESLTDLEGNTYAMANILMGQGVMRVKGGCQGMQSAILPEGEIRGHAHHKSTCINPSEALAFAKRQRHPAPGEAIYRYKQLTASYLHLYFPSNPSAIAKLLTIKDDC